MRQMTNGTTTLNVVEHIILRNFWEYYVTDGEDKDADIKLCLVLGAETEIGDVSLKEIKPYIMMRTTNLSKETEIFPAEGWRWTDTKENS